MKKRLFYLLAAIIACILFLGSWSAISGSGPESGKENIRWYSYEDGIKQVKNTGRKGFLHFYTDWCGYCRKMEQDTFSDSEVIAYLNANFVPIKIDAEDKPKIAEKFGADRFPFNWFIDGETTRIGSRPGFIPPQLMVYILEYVNKNEYREMRLDEYVEQQQK
ncbi:MAG: DUF255 domain-containing protein [Desulfobacterales bacterium]|nr:DUF255 domain-containing protein [Desulfobacterales bacterium]